MVIEKRISDWESILIDTSVLCALFKSIDGGSIDDRFVFVKKLINYLSKTKTANSKNRRFLITSITVSELISRENDSEKIRKILKILDSENIEFIDFDVDTSLQMNHSLYSYLENKKLNKFAAEMGFKSHEFMMAREWIIRDMMIIENGKNANVDVIITCDKNTFYPISKKCSVFTVLAYEKYFKHDHDVILSYDHSFAKLDNLILD